MQPNTTTKIATVEKTPKDRFGLAITSFILGIISTIFFLIATILIIVNFAAEVQYLNTVASLYFDRDETWVIVGGIFFLISGLIGIISFPMGIIAKKTSRGKGMAIAAAVLSFLPMLLFYLFIIGGIIVYIYF